METLGTKVIICLLMLCLPPPDQQPVVVNNYGSECRVINPNRKDAPETLRQIARENARCRSAKGQGKK